MYRRNPDTGEIEFLVIEYSVVKKNHLRAEYKFPGGTNADDKVPGGLRDESPEATLNKEWLVEVGLDISSYIKVRKPLENPIVFPVSGSRHIKRFYVLDESCSDGGQLRKHVHTEVQAGHADEKLGPPEWFSADKLLRSGPFHIYNGTHRRALEQAIEIIKAVEAEKSAKAKQPR